MSQAIVEINVTPNNMVLFQKENILVSPRLETDQMLSQHSPQGYTFISKNNINGTIKITQNGSDYEFNVDAIVKVGLSVFAPLSLIGTQEELSQAKQTKTIEIYNVLAYDIFFGCCPCGDGAGASDTRVYPLSSMGVSALGSRVSYGSILGRSGAVLADAEAPFKDVCILQRIGIFLGGNSCNEPTTYTVMKNGVDTAHVITIPAGGSGYFYLEGINENYGSTDTFTVRLEMSNTATGLVLMSSTPAISYLVVQVGTMGNPFGVLEVSGEVVDNDDPSIQYPKIRVFELITREALLAKIAANEVKIRIYRITDALHTVVSGIDFYSTIDVEGLDTNVISILADNHTDDKVGEYTIGTSGNDDDTFTPQGGSGGGVVDSVVGTTDQIEVDDSDPANPVLSLAEAVTDSLALADTAVQPDALDGYIPLAGTLAGSPVTGDVESVAMKYFETLSGGNIGALSPSAFWTSVPAGAGIAYTNLTSLFTGIIANNLGINVVDTEGFGMFSSTVFIPTSAGHFIQRQYLDDRLPVDYIVTSTFSVTSATETDITDFIIPVEANTMYVISIACNIGCSGAGGTQFGYKFPAGSLMRASLGRTNLSSTILNNAAIHVANTGLIANSYNTVASQNGNFITEATLETGGSAGNFILTFASVTGAQTSSINWGSRITIRKANT